MNPTDEMAAKIETANIPGTSDQKRPVEHLDNLLWRVSHHLDYENSERATIYYRLVAIDNLAKRIERQTKRRASRVFVLFLVAICIGVAGTLAWQSYGEAIKQTIATRAPELGRSPEAKQMIASWVQHLGWMKPPAGPEITTAQPSVLQTTQATTVAQSALETVAPNVPVAPSLDAEKVPQITLDLAALRQAVEQLAGGQDQMSRKIDMLKAADVEILQRIPASPPQTLAVPARKPISVLPSSRTSIPSH